MSGVGSIDWRRHLRLQGVTLGLIVLVLWGAEVLDVLLKMTTAFELDHLGIVPRRAWGLPGVLLAPFLHVSFQHLAANTLPLLVLASFMLLEGGAKFWKAMIIMILASGSIVWLFGAAGSLYLGSSSVVYGCFGYVLMRAWLTRQPVWIALGLVALLIYGGLGASLLTLKEGVSWLGHAAGLISGMLAADRLHEGSRR